MRRDILIGRVLRLGCALLCALLLVGTGRAPALAEQSPVVRVGYYENEVFQEGAREGAVRTGYAYEYYRKLSEYTGWKYEYVYGEFSDLYRMLLEGEIDLLAGLARLDDREGLIGYPQDPMGYENYSLVGHDADTAYSSDPQTLSGASIGVLDSAMVAVLQEWLREQGVTARIVTYPDYEKLFTAFDSHEVDILAAEGDGAYGRSHADVLCTFGSSDYYLCVSIHRPDLLEELDRAQSLLRAEEPNYLSSLSARYYPVSVTSRAYSMVERDWMRTHDALHIGYLNHYLPYCDTDAEGRTTGLLPDLVSEMFDDLSISHIRATYRGFDSYDEMIAAVVAGQIDAAFPVGGGLYYSEESGIYQSTPVVSVPTDLIYRGEYSPQKTARFAVNENNRVQYYYVKTNFPEAEIALYPSIEDCLEAVRSGAVGSTTLNGLRAGDILKNSKYRDLSMLQLSRSDDHCFGVCIGNEGLLKLLNRGVNVLGSDYAQSISYRYTEGLYTVTFADTIRRHAGVFLAAILSVLALIIFLLVRDSHRSRQKVREREAARAALEEKNLLLAESREALAGALASAEHANRAKTTFLNNMSHDIRTPMNAIVGFTALAATHLDDPDQVRDYLGKISVSSQHLLSLINDVLDMSRIESGKVTIEETDVHLPEVIHDLRTIIQPNIAAKRQDLFIETQDIVNEDIITDKLRLNQILLNILSNAIKFTPSGGTIRLRVIEKPSGDPGTAHFEFRVRDNGIGMSEEFQKTVFDAFTREQTSTVSGIQGTGLGMAITKNIVDMMGGTITVSSKSGEGSEFVVNIPCRINSEKAKLEPIPQLQGVRALVADGDTDNCLSVCSMLRRIGMRPDRTNCGQEAVIRSREALEHGDEFKVYIIDRMMPDLDGIETVRRIRGVIGDSNPIIILTAYDRADIEDEARSAGVTAICAKPLFLSQLRDALSRPWQTPSADPAGPEPVRFDGKTLLLAEDNAMNQMIAVEILSQTGFCVEIANDGIEAVEMMRSAPAGHYDVILMDIQMPRMDGYEATRRIRALEDPEKARIPIVAATANAFEEDRKSAADAGMNGHLAKPYDIPQMMQTLNALLSES